MAQKVASLKKNNCMLKNSSFTMPNRVDKVSSILQAKGELYKLGLLTGVLIRD